MILCIDPGLRGCGVALFDGARLHHAEYVKNPAVEGRGYSCHRLMAGAVWNSVFKLDVGIGAVLIEHPVYYGSTHGKGDPNDLLDVVAVGAAIAGACYVPTTFITIPPRDWKGQVPKEVMTKRIGASLTDLERKVILPCRKDLMHNVLDAVGIGLWHLSRLNRRKFAND